MNTNPEALAEHFATLARSHNVRVEHVATWSDCRAVAMLPFERPTVRIRPITSQLAYFAAMHELGHVACRHNFASAALKRKGNRAATYAIEAEAWDWAHDHACIVASRPVAAQCARWLASYGR
jgi:hypothetical protein